MKSILSAVIICILLSCASKELSVEDLKFNDTEKAPLKANKIKESIISYDSTYLDKTPFIREGKFDLKEFNLFAQQGTGTGLIRYDSNGNVVFHMIREFMGTVQEFKFDSLQLLKEKRYLTDFTARYNISYRFDGKNRILYQFWKYGYQPDDVDTTLLSFNSSGFVIKEIGHMHDDKSNDRTFSKNYHYKEDTLQKIICEYHKDYENLTKTEETLHYKNGLIHKTETIYSYSKRNKNDFPLIEKIIVNFDNRGLPIRYSEYFEDKKIIVKLINNSSSVSQAK